MTGTLPAGPYRTLETAEGEAFPYYVIPFDRNGLCEAPKTQDHLLAHASDYSDIFLFSHGWNNDWRTATGRYEHFISGFQKLRKQYNLAMPAGYKPLLVGVFWPSQALSWFESEVGPDMAAVDPAARDAAAEELSRTTRDLAGALPAAKRPRFYELMQADALNLREATELAELLASLTAADDEGDRSDKPTAADLLAAAESLAPVEPDYDTIGAAGGAAADPAAPQAAFGFGDVLRAIDPRNLLKPFTVWQMKDRAGQVGANGVATLLQALLAGSQARVHLLGHSFGCKVVMTATCAVTKLPRKVESALLLQAAVSQYAFSPKVPGRNVPGGFHSALERVRTPILATFSERDSPLTGLFHLAVRRHDDLGELQFAAGKTPSRFGALGGFGPQESAARIVDVQDPNGEYGLNEAARLVGVRASRTIGGHSDISNPSTWWAAYCAATAHARQR